MPRLSLVLFAFVLASCARGPEPGPIRIETAGESPATNVVRVTGLSGRELQAVARAKLGQPESDVILRVTVGEGNRTAVLGRIDVTETALEFRPQFPFDLNRRYTVTFDPARLPTPRQAPVMTAIVTFSSPTATESTAVTAVYPSGQTWPENMLRFYVHFSAPMSRGTGVKHVHLQDATGREIPDAILAAYADLWNDDGTRLTVFFDPGRVKRGVGPNLKLGRAIVKGQRYRIVVDREWPDAQGQPLAAAFVREFTAGPAAYAALSTKDWKVTVPPRDTTRPLAIVFPAPLDHALLLRAIGVRTRGGGAPLDGQAATGAGETAWTFTPSAPWKAGAYDIAVLTLLEDPAGNKIGQPFEILPDTPKAPALPDVETMPFDIR